MEAFVPVQSQAWEVQSVTLVRFADRSSAYRFVSEMRRRYDLDRLAAVRVETTPEDVVVEVPNEGWSNEVADVAERHGGHEAASPHELQRLRHAVDAVREIQHETRRHLSETHAAIGDTSDAVLRAEDPSRSET